MAFPRVQTIMAKYFIIVIITFLSISFPCISQPDSCNGIFLSYNYTTGYPLAPRVPPSDPAQQPYRFQSTVTILNNGLYELKSWRMFVGFQHNEILVSASNVMLADGSSLPANVANGAVLAGFPMSDLKTAIETAGDASQMGVLVELVGTQFGIAAPDVPLPSTITLVNDGYLCPPSPTKEGNTTLHMCCTRDLSFPSNSTVKDDYSPRTKGDITIMYDVIKSYDTNYWAQVTIANHSPIGRLDNWHLSWDWMREEFVYAMKGAYPYVVDTKDCIFGRQGEFYKSMDFSTALNCERRPTIIDLPLTKANDTNLGMIPFCCRSGTILPPFMDPSKSKSVFQMQVNKMPPDLNKTQLIPPQNWKINGTFNPEYSCGSPLRVSPSRFPDPTGLPSETNAITSWQVVCNITQTKKANPRCCVSFSAFFNDSVVPCNTCACGCKNNQDKSCSVTAPAILLPSEALLVPFENRTIYVKDKAKLKKRILPNPLPCPDNCGVSINWHLLSDYNRGWKARITIFNWGETDFADWSAAVQFDKAGPGFEAMYSFKGSVVPGNNDTIFMQGLPGLNYLRAEKNGANLKKDFRVPGTQQSVILFNKKKTPGINVAARDGFPTKVFFNGEECSMPGNFPSNRK